MRRILAGAAALAIAFSTVPGFAQEKLAVWWVKGFYKAEDEALFAAITKFEARTGVKVDLSQYAAEDMIPKTVAALDAGSPPDIAYSYDVRIAAKWAFDGKLEDISDVIEPMKDRFLPATIDTTQPAVSTLRAPKWSDRNPATGVPNTMVKLITPTARPAWSSGMPRTSWK